MVEIKDATSFRCVISFAVCCPQCVLWVAQMARSNSLIKAALRLSACVDKFRPLFA